MHLPNMGASGYPWWGALDFAKFSTEELVELLAACGDDAPRRLAEAIVSRGAEALPWLCRLVAEDRWWREGEGMLALHAMHLLGGIGDPSAVSALLAPLRRNEDSDFITEDLPGVLARLGPEAIPELREFVEDRSQDPVMRSVAYTGLVGMAELRPELAEQVKQIGRDVATLRLSHWFGTPVKGGRGHSSIAWMARPWWDWDSAGISTPRVPEQSKARARSRATAEKKMPRRDAKPSPVRPPAGRR